ncbi:MAG: hypothetical protein HY940_03235 [Gammaproteobacteria bacterium]|nr:hypothetical protein [Gammaproteobacteria bacterium]
MKTFQALLLPVILVLAACGGGGSPLNSNPANNDGQPITGGSTDNGKLTCQDPNTTNCGAALTASAVGELVQSISRPWDITSPASATPSLLGILTWINTQISTSGNQNILCPGGSGSVSISPTMTPGQTSFVIDFGSTGTCKFSNSSSIYPNISGKLRLENFLSGSWGTSMNLLITDLKLQYDSQNAVVFFTPTTSITPVSLQLPFGSTVLYFENDSQLVVRTVHSSDAGSTATTPDNILGVNPAVVSKTAKIYANITNKYSFHMDDIELQRNEDGTSIVRRLLNTKSTPLQWSTGVTYPDSGSLSIDADASTYVRIEPTPGVNAITLAMNVVTGTNTIKPLQVTKVPACTDLITWANLPNVMRLSSQCVAGGQGTNQNQQQTNTGGFGLNTPIP